jgi:8-oxo-dGTP pyrophosphatase MutT (NUDIX family)
MPRYRSAKLLLFDATGKVLVLRRSNTHPTAPHAPDLPGGMIEDNESYEEGIIRELVEETQLSVSIDRVLSMYKTGSRFSIMQRKLYATQISDSEPQIELSWEHDRYEWLPIESLTNLETPVQRQVNKVVKKGKYKRI